MKPIYEVRTERGEVYQYLLDDDHVTRSDGADIGYVHNLGNDAHQLVVGDIVTSFSLAGQGVELFNLDPYLVEIGYPSEQYAPIDRAAIVANIGEDALNRLLEDVASYGYTWFEVLTDPNDQTTEEVIDDWAYANSHD